MSPEDDDPVIASYDVYITNTPLNAPDSTSKVFVLQYPSHRPLNKPYNAARSQKPSLLRHKPATGVLEVEVPILTQEHYNPESGAKFGRALIEGQISQRKAGGYGLAGGFNNGPTSAPAVSLRDVPQHDDPMILRTQALGGKVAFPGERDPIYMLGTFRKDELHLTHLDAVVQMRPQLHHIDADEENQKRTNTAANGKTKPGFEASPAKLETKAIEMKLKDNTKEDTKDRNLNANARLLRDIQSEDWRNHDWVDQDEEESLRKLDERLFFKHSNESKILQSMITNDDWLEKMSAPREEGKKGLRSKLKGRDRERARRKKVENQKRQVVGNAATDPTAISSDSDLTSEQSDVEVGDAAASLEEIDIKQDPESLAAAPAQVPPVPDNVAFGTSPTRKRGRPKKSA